METPSTGFNHPLDTRTSRLLRGGTNVETTYAHPCLEERIKGLLNEDGRNFEKELNSGLQYRHFPYDTLKQSNNFHEKFNAPKLYDTFEKNYYPLKHSNSINSIDYIGDIYNNFDDHNYRGNKRLNRLKRGNPYEKKIDTFKYDGNYGNNHVMLKEPFQKKNKSKNKSSVSHFIKFMKKLDSKYERGLLHFINYKMNAHRKNGNNISKPLKMYFNIVSPLLPPALILFIFVHFGLVLGVIFSAILFEGAFAYIAYKISKCVHTYKGDKKSIKKRRQSIL
ncbi:Pv-fam-d protein [Plasmodium ovale wallikeri]|uniref:Pv-fam-d protein n=1 Tax=Plasmodium ovale wallikeri TaxID=864142 RepID=A0A1A9AGD6_PLAOA|nr:Pv-fam-d protein [Plasmodium ovale wallikeri]SBT59275.1 Pv-fam-d protein [Plasmodium ovale wallikeri]